MQTIAMVVQIIIAAGIFNVWVIRYGKPSPYRPHGATNMVEEFRAYGFPDWVREAVRVAKLALAALLVVGLWSSRVAGFAAVGMALLMAVAVAAHVKVKNPVNKPMPALTLLVLSLFVAWVHLG